MTATKLVPCPMVKIIGLFRFWVKINKDVASLHRGPVLTTAEKFENAVFTLKTHEILSVHRTPEEFDHRPF